MQSMYDAGIRLANQLVITTRMDFFNLGYHERSHLPDMNPPMELQPITYDEACEFGRKHQCGQIPLQGWKFGIAVNDGDKIVGVITVGKPAAQYKDDGRTLEATMCCTDGTVGAASMLYRTALQATRSLGYTQLITYTVISETGEIPDEPEAIAITSSRVSPEERSSLNSILGSPTQKKEKPSDIDNLRIQLKKAETLFKKLGHQDWVDDVSNALASLDRDDFSFLESLWLKFARDVDDLILIAPRLHEPPLTEAQADRLNGELAEVANATFAALDKVRETRASLISGLV